MKSPLRIVMIHGLAAKPSRKRLLEQWSEVLLANLCYEDPNAAMQAERDECMRMAWWADAVPDHVIQSEAEADTTSAGLPQLLAERERLGSGFHVEAGAAAQEYYRDRGADLMKLLELAHTAQDLDLQSLHELRLYYADQYIADRIRLPLERELRDAWSSGCRVALLAHSMGSIIALDVLWRFSHRAEPEFADFRAAHVDYLATLGSPLAQERVRHLLLSWRHEGERAFPGNIECWENFSCLGDVISRDTSFEEAWFAPMRALGLLTASSEYLSLYNPWSDAGGTRNPHKSFGYLVQPRLASRLAQMLYRHY